MFERGIKNVSDFHRIFILCKVNDKLDKFGRISVVFKRGGHEEENAECMGAMQTRGPRKHFSLGIIR